MQIARYMGASKVIATVPMPRLLAAISKVYQAAVSANLRIATKAVPLAQVEETWTDDGKARIVFLVG